QFGATEPRAVPAVERGTLLPRQRDCRVSQVEDVAEHSLRKRAVCHHTGDGVGWNGGIGSTSDGGAAAAGMQVHSDLRQAQHPDCWDGYGATPLSESRATPAHEADAGCLRRAWASCLRLHPEDACAA